MLTSAIRVVIPGDPAPKGSLKCIGGAKGKGHRLIEDNARTKPWRDKIATACRHRLEPYRAAKGQPICAEITFTLNRPKGHYGTGRNAGVLKTSAPAFPVSHSTGDTDKLLRLVLDALQDALVLPDDCAVVDVTSRKRFIADGSPDPDVLAHPGVVIRLYPVAR
jgi:Holliday junction resolvase RusA-like endonuclease